ncbi:hypothetical protein [Lysobacter gummosus]|uniref:hypothetical protein n=1 Tax=Lysobacter gummosus TaxID=262324 RepID=UPI0036270A55
MSASCLDSWNSGGSAGRTRVPNGENQAKPSPIRALQPVVRSQFTEDPVRASSNRAHSVFSKHFANR